MTVSGTPTLARTRAELAAVRESARTAAAGTSAGGPVAVVMTMGALHAGHTALIRAARARSAVVIVTIFVNPLQFGPTEDFAVYPRTLEGDLAICARENVDIVFAPSTGEIYRSGEALVRVSPGPAGALLEGESRPGFFEGVLTVVAKMFHLTAPDLAFFGQKDAQQLAVVRRMAADLDFPVEIVGVPTVREEDGLALSSRNRYLSPAERTTALALSQALAAARLKTADGPDAVRASAEVVLTDAAAADPPLATDYLALVHPDTFTEVAPDHTGPAILAVAARVGTTRLIDNAHLTLGGVR